MKAWRIDNARFDNLEEELRKSERLELPAPWHGLLAQIDPRSGAYQADTPAAFLFITKEGTCGVVRIDLPKSYSEMKLGSPYSANDGIHHRFIYEDPDQK